MLHNEELQIDLSYWSGEEENRLKTLKLLLEGYSNNCIAKELNFSLKNIESIIAKLFRRSSIITRGPQSHLINPRAKLLSLGVCKDWLRYSIQDKVRNQELLSRNQFLTLILCAAGCSNKAIAEFLCISSKTVESRLNALFNQFGVNSQSDKQVNPRIRLIVSAIKQKVLSPYSVKIASEILNVEQWQEVMKNREQIKENFLRLQFEQSRPYILQPENSLANLTDKLTSAQQQPVYSLGGAPPQGYQQQLPQYPQPQQQPYLPPARPQGQGNQNWG
ncbi:MAG: LuxR C-terminal-related transcriptional regulator [Candidatus Caenarcaniphilales bacterium]|nr:LuxR C-terminal-related transcriptional regulator [Candidatus Caenarcaniphilales bacterium]